MLLSNLQATTALTRTSATLLQGKEKKPHSLSFSTVDTCFCSRAITSMSAFTSAWVHRLHVSNGCPQREALTLTQFHQALFCSHWNKWNKSFTFIGILVSILADVFDDNLPLSLPLFFPLRLMPLVLCSLVLLLCTWLAFTDWCSFQLLNAHLQATCHFFMVVTSQ